MFDSFFVVQCSCLIWFLKLTAATRARASPGAKEAAWKQVFLNFDKKLPKNKPVYSTPILTNISRNRFAPGDQVGVDRDKARRVEAERNKA